MIMLNILNKIKFKCVLRKFVKIGENFEILFKISNSSKKAQKLLENFN